MALLVMNEPMCCGNWHLNEAEQTGFLVHTHLFKSMEMPQCSAECRQSSKQLISHLQVIQGVFYLTTFTTLGSCLVRILE